MNNKPLYLVRLWVESKLNSREEKIAAFETDHSDDYYETEAVCFGLANGFDYDENSIFDEGFRSGFERLDCASDVHREVAIAQYENEKRSLEVQVARVNELIKRLKI